MQRRDFIKAGFALGLPTALISSPNKSSAQSAEDLDYTDYNGGPPPSYQLYGTNPPLGPEIVQARKILDAAPKTGTLIDIGNYFESLTDRNKDGEYFNAAWKERWNPIIVEFYNSTSLPKKQIYTQGDTIAWCAAYLNWALARLGKRGTNNAMSGSFRAINGHGTGLGKETTSPSSGDVIVFKIRNANPDVGHGHVSVYLDETSTAYRVIGGNQKAGKRYSSINTTNIPKSNYVLEEVSFRQFSSIPNFP